MNHAGTYYRNKVLHGAYTHVLKPFFFRRDPEAVHDRMTRVGIWLGNLALGRKATAALFDYRNPVLEQRVLGIGFKNPVGLSAGFDKNSELTDILPSVGFGFAEVGSVTGEPCSGNPKPRLWRLPRSKSLAVYYGLKNHGCEAIAERLRNKKFSIPVGISVAMTNRTQNLDTQSAVEDYAKAFRTMEPFASYLTVNVSCPNVAGGQPFMDPGNLDLLLGVLDGIPTEKPVFVKLSPDMSEAELDRVLLVLRRHRVQGIICTNLTKKRTNARIIDTDVPPVGGLSGKAVEDLSDRMLAAIYKKEGGRFALIGSGGVFSAEDAYRKIRLGASLIQMITGMVFEGPQVVSEINRGLADLLRRDGFRSVADAVGVDNC